MPPDGGDAVRQAKVYYPPKWRHERDPKHDTQHFQHGESRESEKSQISASRSKRLRLGLEADLKAQKMRARRREMAIKNNHRIKSQLELERIERERRIELERIKRERRKADEEVKRAWLAKEEEKRKKEEARQKAQKLKEELEAKEAARIQAEAKAAARKKASIWSCFGLEAVEESQEEEAYKVRAGPSLMELESADHLSDDVIVEKVSPEEARRREKQATRDLLTAMLLARPSERSEAAGPVIVKKKKEEVDNVLDKEIGHRSPTLLAMIANAKHELRPPPPEKHKKEYVPLIKDVAIMGRFNRLPENIIEAYGKRSAEEFNTTKTDKSYADWELNHATRGQNRKPLIVRNRPEAQIMINEAAAVGKMMSQLMERQYDFNYVPEEDEIDDLGDEKRYGAKVFRTEHLIDRHLKNERRVDWTPDYDVDEYKTLDEVTLPSLEQPKFKPRIISRSEQERRDDLARQVAEGYWERYDRLERRQAKLVVTQGCFCKYCKSANAWQTFAYQKKWADERLPSKDELDDNPDPEKYGYIQRLYLPQAVQCEEININEGVATDTENKNHRSSPNISEDLERTDDSEAPVINPREASMISSMVPPILEQETRDADEAPEELETNSKGAEDLEIIDESEDKVSIEPPVIHPSEASMISSMVPSITGDVDEAPEMLETKSTGASEPKSTGQSKVESQDDMAFTSMSPLTGLTSVKKGEMANDSLTTMTTQSAPIVNQRRKDDLLGSKMDSARSLEKKQKPRKIRPLKWMKRKFLGHSNTIGDTKDLNTEKVYSSPEPVVAITGSADASNMEMVDSGREESHPRSSDLPSSSSVDEQVVTSLDTQPITKEDEDVLLRYSTKEEEIKIKDGMETTKLVREMKVESEKMTSLPMISEEFTVPPGNTATTYGAGSRISEESAALLEEMAKLHGPGRRKSARRGSNYIRESASMLDKRKSLLRDPSVMTLKAEALSPEELIFASDDDIIALTLVPEHINSSENTGNAPTENTDDKKVDEERLNFNAAKAAIAQSTRTPWTKSIEEKVVTEANKPSKRPQFNRYASTSLISKGGVQSVPSFKQNSPAPKDFPNLRPHLNRFASASSIDTGGSSWRKPEGKTSASWIKGASAGESTTSTPVSAPWAKKNNTFGNKAIPNHTGSTAPWVKPDIAPTSPRVAHNFNSKNSPLKNSRYAVRN